MVKRIPCVYPDCFNCLRPDCNVNIVFGLNRTVKRNDYTKAKQQAMKLYAYMVEYFQKRGYFPSDKEISKEFGKSKETLKYYLSYLAENKIIEPEFGNRKYHLRQYELKGDSKLTPEEKERRMNLLRQRDEVTTEVYRYVYEYIYEYGYAPSFSEIADELGMSSTTAKRHVLRLIDMRYLKTKHPGQSRAFGLTRYRLAKIKRKKDE